MSSFPNQDSAVSVARLCLQAKLCACVQIQNAVTSMYIWDNELKQKAECLVYFKTLAHLEKDLYTLIATHHPYDCPEIITCALSHVFPAYQEWIINICQTQTTV